MSYSQNYPLHKSDSLSSMLAISAMSMKGLYDTLLIALEIDSKPSQVLDILLLQCSQSSSTITSQ